MPKVVGRPRQRRGGDLGGEGGLSSAPPHPPNGHRGQLAAVALADEQPPVRLDSELPDVGVEQSGQRGRAGHHTDLPAGALLKRDLGVRLT